MPHVTHRRYAETGDVPSCAADARAAAGALPEGLLDRPVLVLEDEAMIAWMLESLLEDLGFADITITSSGEEAIEAADRLRPGLILSDINLGPSGIDGVEAAAAIRRSLHAPVIFVSGYAGPDARERIARDIPDALVLRKPIQPDEIRRAIEQAAAMREH